MRLRTQIAALTRSRRATALGLGCVLHEGLLGAYGGQCLSNEEPLAHGTEEFMPVLEGVMDIEIGPRRHVLEPRDAINYSGVTPHRFFSTADQDLILISAVSPPVAGRRTSASYTSSKPNGSNLRAAGNGGNGCAVPMAGLERHSGGRKRLGWPDPLALLGRSSCHVCCTHCGPNNPME